MNKVLGMELLPIKQPQRYTRKRRREGSTGEGYETEDSMFNIIIIIIINQFFIFYKLNKCLFLTLDSLKHVYYSLFKLASCLI